MSDPSEGGTAFVQNTAFDVHSAKAVADGLRLLHGFRLADDEAEHAVALLALMDPPPGAVVVDMGCGFGELPRLMHQQRPDLRFVLVNASGYQLAHCPPFMRVQADMQRTPLADASVDVAMFAWSLCQVDLDAALAEAARVTRPGGVLFVFDSERVAGDNATSLAVSRAAWFSRETLAEAASKAGYVGGWFHEPAGSDAVLREMMATAPDQYAAIFGGLRPVVWRLVRS